MTNAATAGTVKREADEVAHSEWVDLLARIGLLSRGAVYLLVGLIAVGIAIGRRHTPSADNNGAFRALADTPVGGVLIGLLAVGFVGYALWALSDALVGHRDEQGWKRALERVENGFRALVYLALAYSAVRLLATGNSGGSSNQRSQALTAKLLGEPLGRPLIVAIGAGFVVAGVVHAYRGVSCRFDEELKTAEMGSTAYAVVTPLGIIGYAARGVVFALVGAFLIQAAVTYDPVKAKGLDGALRAVAETPWGRVVLGVVAAGLIAFGLYTFADARYRRTGREERRG